MTHRSALLALAAATLVAGRASGQTCAANKVAVADGPAILASIPRYASRDSNLAVHEGEYRVDLSRQQALLDSLAAAYRAKATLLPAASQRLELAKLQDQRADIQQHVRTQQQQLAQQRQALLQPIEVGVQAVVDSIRGNLDCAMVFNLAAGNGIISVNKGVDLTQRVIDAIKAAQARGDTAAFGPLPVPAKRP